MKFMYQGGRIVNAVRQLRLHSSVRYVSATTTTAETSGERSNTNTEGGLYDTHVPTNCFQRGLLAIGSGLMAFSDPRRDDMVGTFGEVTGTFALRSMESVMRADPVGRRILTEKPRITSQSVGIDQLPNLDGATFGYAYANWVKSQKVTPDSRKPVKFVDDVEQAYVMQRYREIHDFTHVALGQPISLLGETFVKIFEAIQTGLPMCALAGIFAPLKLTSDERMLLFTRGLPWISANARRARPFLCVYFEEHFEMPLAQLRRDVLNIDEPPFGVKFTK